MASFSSSAITPTEALSILKQHVDKLIQVTFNATNQQYIILSTVECPQNNNNNNRHQQQQSDSDEEGSWTISAFAGKSLFERTLHLDELTDFLISTGDPSWLHLCTRFEKAILQGHLHGTERSGSTYQLTIDNQTPTTGTTTIQPLQFELIRVSTETRTTKYHQLLTDCVIQFRAVGCRLVDDLFNFVKDSGMNSKRAEESGLFSSSQFGGGGTQSGRIGGGVSSSVVGTMGSSQQIPQTDLEKKLDQQVLQLQQEIARLKTEMMGGGSGRKGGTDGYRNGRRNGGRGGRGGGGGVTTGGVTIRANGLPTTGLLPKRKGADLLNPRVKKVNKEAVQGTAFDSEDSDEGDEGGVEEGQGNGDGEREGQQEEYGEEEQDE